MSQITLKPGTVLEGFRSLIFPENPAESNPMGGRSQDVFVSDKTSQFTTSDPRAQALTESKPPPIRGIFRPKSQ